MLTVPRCQLVQGWLRYTQRQYADLFTPVFFVYFFRRAVVFILNLNAEKVIDRELR